MPIVDNVVATLAYFLDIPSAEFKVIYADNKPWDFSIPMHKFDPLVIPAAINELKSAGIGGLKDIQELNGFLNFYYNDHHIHNILKDVLIDAPLFIGGEYQLEYKMIESAKNNSDNTPAVSYVYRVVPVGGGGAILMSSNIDKNIAFALIKQSLKSLVHGGTKINLSNV